MDAINSLARPEILRMTAYSSARKEGEQRNMSVYLDANENPYLPFPATPDTIGFNRYPEPQPENLLDLFAEHYSVSGENLLITRGADEAIDLLVRGFCRPGQDGVLINPPTFGMYEIAATVQNAALFLVPLRKSAASDDNVDASQARGFALDVERILRTHRENPHIKLIFVCSPNNPTGGLLPREDVLSLCDELCGKALVVVDETYVEFSGEPSLSRSMAERPNLVVLRTLSKEYGLAGERCGVTIAHPAVIGIMDRILAPYPIPASSIRAVQAAMSPEGVRYAHDNIQLIVEQRRYVEKILADSPVVSRVYPSDTNFLLVEIAPDREPAQLMAMMEANGIKIRDRSTVSGIENCVRISVGTPEQNQQMLAVFSQFAARLRP